MAKISGKKKFLAVIALSFSCIACSAQDEKKNSADNDSNPLQLLCFVGFAACISDFLVGFIPWGLQGKSLSALRAIELLLSSVFAYGVFICENRQEANLKEAKQKQLEKKNQKNQKLKQNQEPKISSEDKQKEEMFLEEFEPFKKKRFRDKFRSWVRRFKEL